MTGVGWSEWRRAAATPRMIALLVLVMAVAVLFIRLGSWQLDRAALRGAAEAEQITAERIAAEPVPLESVISVGDTFMSDHQLMKVEARGQWGRQVVVPDREVDGAPAVLVVTELRLENGAWVPVLRGWLPVGDFAAIGMAGLPSAVAAISPAPEGKGEVVGHLTGSEDSVTGDLPDGVAGAVSTATLANEWGGPTYTGFVVAADGEQWDLRTMPPPSYAQERGLNTQNLVYAAEWFIFGGFALFVWWKWVRDDAVRTKEAEILAQAEGPQDVGHTSLGEFVGDNVHDQ
ncbi:MAG TPA: SURF1 family protein [Actinomycetaceae bacterium]|nr:SURF1 family protein [Actinomycetaceae bacterium]